MWPYYKSEPSELLFLILNLKSWSDKISGLELLFFAENIKQNDQ